MRTRKVRVENELLTGAVNRFAQENTPEVKEEMIKYLLGSGMLLPVKIVPSAKRDTQGNYLMTPKHKVAYATVKNVKYEKDPEACYYLAFTDSHEMRKWSGGKSVDSFIAYFDDYAIMLLKPGATCKGIVVNPAGANLVITTQAIRQIIKDRDAQAEE